MQTAIKLGCIAIACLSAVACVAIGMAPYPAAAVMAGTGVAAAGVNRSLAGACWGSGPLEPVDARFRGEAPLHSLPPP